MKVIVLLSTIGILNALHCDKDYNFDKRGYYITCQDLSSEHLDILQNITINNEISLEIDNSVLYNVSSEIFRNVGEIRFLTIKHSIFTFLPSESIFKTLPKLEHITIQNTTFHMNEYTFSGINHLRELVLSKNGLIKVEESTLKHLDVLELFQLTENMLEDTANIVMCELKNLKSLNLSSNLIESVDYFSTLCESPTSMDFSGNGHSYASNVSKDDYTIYEFDSNLVELDLSHNRLRSLGDLFNTVKYVQVANLQENMLTQLKNSDFKLLKDLRDLYLQNNNITTIEDRVFHGKNNLERLDLSRNGLTFFSITDLPMLRYLNLGSNKLKEENIDVINSTKTLQKFFLYDNNISEVKPYAFQRFNKLELLDLNDNHIKLNNNSFRGLFEMKTLFLAGNQMKVLPETIFRDLRKLKTIDLSRNEFKALYPATFNGLKNVKVLNISHNHLEGLDYVLLNPLKNLHVLDISDNNLHYIQYDSIISNLPSLSVLNIQQNRLSCKFLIEIAGYLKLKSINYTMQEKIDTFHENVAGIFCANEESMAGLQTDTNTGHTNLLFNTVMTVVSLFLVFIMGIIGFKIYIYLKRRKYRADEFELIVE
ncbi:podocan-like [Leptinotarsa decemlineata]|uniref:podocan-like n=1 Tax=Leptinotarsa decemlineata TaxID=7539 RepID=UPI003D308DF1